MVGNRLTINSQQLTNLKQRECKAVFVVNDAEISQFSDEITANWAVLVQACMIITLSSDELALTLYPSYT